MRVSGTAPKTSLFRRAGRRATGRRDQSEGLGHYTRGIWVADLVLLGAVLVAVMLLAHVFDKKGSNATAPGEETTVEIIDD